MKNQKTIYLCADCGEETDSELCEICAVERFQSEQENYDDSNEREIHTVRDVYPAY